MIGAGIILLNRNNEVLLLLRDNKIDIPFPNMWDIPGGRVEESETRYLGLFESIRDAILIADTTRNIINCNCRFYFFRSCKVSKIFKKSR